MTEMDRIVLDMKDNYNTYRQENIMSETRKSVLRRLCGIEQMPDAVLMLQIEDIDTDTIYQRDHSEARMARKHVLKMTKEWDDRLMDPIRVCLAPDGSEYKYNTINGGFRIECHKEMGRVSIKAIVVQSSGLKDEAKMFTEGDRGVKKIAAYDKYNAGVVAGDALYTDIKNIVESTGYCVARSVAKNAFTPITVLVRLVKANRSIAHRAMEVAASICDPEPISGRMLKGLFVMLIDPKGISAHNLDKLQKLGRAVLEAEMDRESYEAPKGAQGGRVSANAIRKALRKRIKYDHQ